MSRLYFHSYLNFLSLALLFLIGCKKLVEPAIAPIPPTIPPGIPPEIPPEIKILMENVRNNCGSSKSSTAGDNSPIICGNTLIILLPPDKNKNFIPVVTVLSKDYQWKKGKIDEVENTNKGLGVLVEQMKQPGMQALLSRSRDIIAVGTASYEGENVNENERAKRRSEEILKTVRTKNLIPINNDIEGFYTLNLGKYKKECIAKFSILENDKQIRTAYQRPIMVAVVLKRSENITKAEIEEELRKKLQELPQELSLECYPNFDFKRG